MALNLLTPELYCSDLKRSLTFYIDILGFKILYERPENGFAYLDREGVHIMLEDLSQDRKWLTGEMSYPFGRGMNFQIKVSDVDSLYQSVLNAKITPFLSIEEKWYRRDTVLVGNRQFLVQDPDGYLLRFAQDLGSKPVVESV